jgi:hypothetical protein
LAGVTYRFNPWFSASFVCRILGAVLILGSGA